MMARQALVQFPFRSSNLYSPTPRRNDYYLRCVSLYILGTILLITITTTKSSSSSFSSATAFTFPFATPPRQSSQPPPSIVKITSQPTSPFNPSHTADVGIIGAGPAGLTLAHALLARNHTVHLFERRPSFRPVGAAVFLHPFALNSLRRVSPTVERRLREASTPIRKIAVTGIGEDQMDVGTERLDEATEVFGSPFVAVRFWDMLRALREGLDDRTFSFGYAMERFELIGEKGDGGVRLHFLTLDDDGTYSVPKTFTVGALIDAAGIRSSTRRQLVGDEPIPRLRATYAVADAADVERTVGIGANGDRELSFVVGSGVSVTTASLKNGDVWWTQTQYSDDPTADIVTEDEGEDAMRGRLEERFAAWPSKIRGLVSATPSPTIIESTISELPVSWWGGTGPVTLLGDAAHAQLPSLGLGISTAFADVDELCKQVDRWGDGKVSPRGLRWYEAVRIPQTACLQLASRLAFFGNLYLGREDK